MRNWTWTVLYTDGTELTEDQAGTFGAVDMPRVETLVVFDRNDPNANYAVAIRDDMRPIFFRRVRKLTLNDPETIPIEYIDENGEFRDTYVHATALGWQRTVNGKNVKSLLWLMYDGSVAITDRDIDHL